MRNVDRIISQSISKTFDKLMPEDKAKFFDILERKHHFNFSSVSQNFGVFHLALKEVYPLKHYRIETEIVKTMHEDTMNGKNKLTDEIEAFSIMTRIIQEDQRQTIERIKNKLDAIDQTKHTIEQELLTEENNIKRLNAFFKEIHDFR